MLKFAFDYISPFAHLAWAELPALAKRHELTIKPIPVFFAGLLKHHGTVGPAEVPAKRAYLISHLARMATAQGVEFGVPPSHPFNPLLALRTTTAAQSSEKQPELIDALFAEVWGPRARGVTESAIVQGICADLGLQEAYALSGSTDTKNALRKNTEWAIQHGAFGVPTVWTEDGAMFWGVDALPHLEAHLRGEPPVDAALVHRWETMPQHHRT